LNGLVGRLVAESTVGAASSGIVPGVIKDLSAVVLLVHPHLLLAWGRATLGGHV